jgi:hypothetical protein
MFDGLRGEVRENEDKSSKIPSESRGDGAS